MSRIKSWISLCMSLFVVFSPVAASNAQEGALGGVTFVKPGNVTVNFKDADIRAVLRYLSEVGGVDIVPSPDVAGAVTLNLTDKPWNVALDIIIKNYGYAYERDGDIIRVVTLSSLKLEELSTEVIPLNYATAEDAQETVQDMLTDRGKMTYDVRVNALVVTDLATNIYKIKNIIADLDKRTPQLMIEAKIIETALNDTERLGIDWNFVIAAAGAARPTTFPWTNANWRSLLPRALERFLPYGQTGAASGAQSGASDVITTTGIADFPADGAVGSSQFPFVGTDAFAYGTLDFSQFRAVLEYLKSRSDTDIISNPRITTLNNKPAKMFVGKVYNYISEVEQQEDTGGAQRWTYKIEKEEIGIRLLVTPHINSVGDIEIELQPEIKDVIGFQQVTEFFSLPIFTTREAETQVILNDGQTIFIGGLIKESVKKSVKKFPILGDLLGDVPLLGNLFKHSTEIQEKTELVFFLTVHVVKDLDEFNKLASRGISDIKMPFGSEKSVFSDAASSPDEVFVELPGPDAARKPHKPIFNLRKGRKGKSEEAAKPGAAR